MSLTRRSTLAAAAGLVGLGSVPAAFAQPAATDDQRKTERSLGDAAAKVTVIECFSLTCSHCAAFARGTMPLVEKELIEPGKLRYVFHDFPLDQVALTAAMVSRYLPATRYYPFISALFANQDRWAFARGINSTEELWKMAALAGMSRATFDKAIADTDLRNWILAQQQADQDRWKIDSTPSFIVDGKTFTGEMGYDAFRKIVPGV